LRYGKLIYFFLLNFQLKLVDVDVVWVIHVVHIAVDDQKQFVLEFIGGTGVDCWIEEA
jgi:hypothetical protein